MRSRWGSSVVLCGRVHMNVLEAVVANAQSRPHTPPSHTHLHQRAQPDGRRLLDKSNFIPRQLRLVPREGLGTNVLQRLQPRVGPQADRPLPEEGVVDLRLRGAGRDGGGEGALGQLGCCGGGGGGDV